jgi:hypothetical protein
VSEWIQGVTQLLFESSFKTLATADAGGSAMGFPGGIRL